MPLVIGPLDGLGLEMHVGHGLGLVHDLGLGVAQAISLIGITSGNNSRYDHLDRGSSKQNSLDVKHAVAPKV